MQNTAEKAHCVSCGSMSSVSSVDKILNNILQMNWMQLFQDSVSNPIIQGTLLYHTTHCHLKPHQWRKFNQEV